jgi:hypothetical protein
VAVGQAQFACKWQTRKSSVTGKHSITVNVTVNEGKASGTVLLVNPEASVIESKMLSVELHGDTLEFETKAGNDAFPWWLALEKDGRRGRLYGSIREMLIDEKVAKNH